MHGLSADILSQSVDPSLLVLVDPERRASLFRSPGCRNLTDEGYRRQARLVLAFREPPISTAFFE
jgi:hypothetical protein